jgi:hypothetical protein
MAAKLKGGRKRKTMKKGGFYSFSGAVGPGAANWTRGTEVPVLGGRKKRKSSKKTKKVKKGGLRFAQANVGFTGVGTARGLGGYQDVSAPGGKAEFGSFADNGAKPGDFSSFK